MIADDVVDSTGDEALDAVAEILSSSAAPSHSATPHQASGKSMTTEPRSPHYTHLTKLDDFDHQGLRHRAELDAVNKRISTIDATLEGELAKLREIKAAVDSLSHARARLVTLRGAMLQFVQELRLHDANQ